MDAALPPQQVRPVTVQTAPLKLATPAKRAEVERSAQAFEASFLSSMFGQMFDGVKTAPPFGGGDAEDAFRSFFSDALGKEVARHGGIGLAKTVSREMLKLQGLS